MGIQNGVRIVSKKLLLTLIFTSILLLTLILCTLESGSAQSISNFDGIIRITSGGTVEGTDKISRSGNVYTLVDDIVCDVAVGSVFIYIDRTGVIFDGAGKTLQGTNGGIAIKVNGNDITIKNTRIINFGTAVEISYDDSYTNNQIIDNYFETRWGSVILRGAKHVLSGNTFIARNGNAVERISDKTTFTNNAFIDCCLNLPDGPGVLDVFSGNTVNGKPFVFLVRQSNQIIDGVNQVILISCTNMVIQNINNIGLSSSIQLFDTTNTKITNCKSHIWLTNSHNNTIINNKITAAYIALTNSNNNTIINNELSAVKYSAVGLYNSSKNMITQNLIEGEYGGGIIIGGQYNRVERNNITYRSGGDVGTGIAVSGCNNYVYENSITADDNGIAVDSGEYNFIFNNKIYQCKKGITLFSSSYNNIFGNTLSEVSDCVVHLFMSDYNNFFGNSFKDNTKTIEVNTDIFWLMNATYYAEYNKWDNGKEGNYWSDYHGQDTNGNGIGKTPYNVYGNFIDYYPLTKPYDVSKIQVTFEAWNETYTGSTWDDTHTGPQSPNSERDNQKIFLIIPIIVIGTVIGIVSVAFLVYFKKVNGKRKTLMDIENKNGLMRFVTVL